MNNNLPDWAEARANTSRLWGVLGALAVDPWSNYCVEAVYTPLHDTLPLLPDDVRAELLDYVQGFAQENDLVDDLMLGTDSGVVMAVEVDCADYVVHLRRVDFAECYTRPARLN